MTGTGRHSADNDIQGGGSLLWEGKQGLEAA